MAGGHTRIVFRRNVLLPLRQLLFECFERILDLGIGERNSGAGVVGGELEPNILGEMGEFG